MATEKQQPKVEEAVEKAAETKGTRYFKCRKYAGYKLLGQEGETLCRFLPFIDTFKGDKVKIGFLATDSKAAIDRCLGDPLIEEITDKEYKEALKLRRAGFN